MVFMRYFRPQMQSRNSFENGSPGSEVYVTELGHVEYGWQYIESCEIIANLQHSNGTSSVQPNITLSASTSKLYPRLSSSVERLHASYDVVVIGSGYGASVSASRMARAGQSVCVLERGRERWPGEYPSSLVDVTKSSYISSVYGEQGDPMGLYRMHVGEGINTLSGNGLGGTSLINGNVFLTADQRTMSLPEWPPDLQVPGALDEYYKLAEGVLQPEPYPEDWPTLPKLNILQRQAEGLGYSTNFRRVAQTTRFMNGPNSTGVEMNPSTLTGQDCTGVNDGSKSTTLVNYLCDAWNWDAEMFCECEVRYVTKCPEGGYLIYFAWHGNNRGKFKDIMYGDLMFVHARKCVFLGAGSLGTTEILLRSKKKGLSISDKIGTNMSGNGDIGAFTYDCKDLANAIGKDFPSPYSPIGPTICGMIDCRNEYDDPRDGFVIQEGAAPAALAPLLRTMLDWSLYNSKPLHFRLNLRIKRLVSHIISRVLGPYYPYGVLQRTLTLLVVSHDSNKASLALENDRPQFKFLDYGRSTHSRHLRGILRKAAEAVGGSFVDNPFHCLEDQQETSVHPVGGARMSFDGTAENGVTNSFGEVLLGTGIGSSREVYKGLIVADGAVLPTSLAANPMATITALAERSVRHAAESFGVEIDYETKNGNLDLFGPPQVSHRRLQGAKDEEMTVYECEKCSRIEFTEVMSGFMSIGDDNDGNKDDGFETAARSDHSPIHPARLFLSAKSQDDHTLFHSSKHSAVLTGVLSYPELTGSPFMILRGSLQCFTHDQDVSDTQRMVYDFDLIPTSGETLHFHGYKTINSSLIFSPSTVWEATTTLHATITSNSTGTILSRGILKIEPKQFLTQLRTICVYGGTELARLSTAFSFLSFFTSQLAHYVFLPFMPLQYPLPTPIGFTNTTPANARVPVVASDGIVSYLYKWEATSPPEIKVHNLLMIPGAAVDHQIFSLGTIPVNAVQYFTSKGYRVWVNVTRIGMSPQAKWRWTTFDARLDIAAALDYIRSRPEGYKNGIQQKIYTIAHCMGSVAYSCGLLDGTIPAEWISGITCSQVFMNPIWAEGNMAKARSPLPLDKGYEMVAGNWLSLGSNGKGRDTWVQSAINQLMRFWFLAYFEKRGEACMNVSCHRWTLVFGRCWNHANLNEATHRQVDRFGNGVNTTLLRLLIHQGSIGHVTTNFQGAGKSEAAPVRLTTPENVQRLKRIPFFLFSGGDSQVLNPESTLETARMLKDVLGDECGDVERAVIKGYGHLDSWMGTNAWMDVWPLILERADRVCRAEEQGSKTDVAGMTYCEDLRKTKDSDDHRKPNGGTERSKSFDIVYRYAIMLWLLGCSVTFAIVLGFS